MMRVSAAGDALTQRIEATRHSAKLTRLLCPDQLAGGGGPLEAEGAGDLAGPGWAAGALKPLYNLYAGGGGLTAGRRLCGGEGRRGALRHRGGGVRGRGAIGDQRIICVITTERELGEQRRSVKPHQLLMLLDFMLEELDGVVCVMHKRSVA